MVLVKDSHLLSGVAIGCHWLLKFFSPLQYLTTLDHT